MNYSTPSKLIRQPAVEDKTGWPNNTLRTRYKNGDFPRPISIGERSIAWVERECDQVIEAMIAGKSKKEIKELVAKLHAARTGDES
jgi:prophage regulatory protein